MVNMLLDVLRHYVSTGLCTPVLLIFAWLMGWRIAYYVLGVDD